MPDPIDVKVGFRVVAESDDWIVVDKSAPLIVHPTGKKSEPTLLGGIEELLSYEIANGAKLSIINRLDRETSGVVIVAKNKSAARMFGRAMERRQFAKQYDAICFGWPDWDEILVDAPIRRRGEVEHSAIWVKQMVHPGGRECRTHFEVVARRMVRGRKVSRLRVIPETGRMHQIRVHASYLGYPLVGDKIYGEDETCYLRFIESGWDESMEQQLLMRRHALHAAEMALRNEEVAYDWATPMAEDLHVFFGA
ncbi:RluA family pseudouridine synthase [Rubritalea tangerina]|uniref:RluA family pseudouridine synthase n=1 Tax=Rubritalea tangerina TaxID=430798 RepID=A0ABW4ZCU1_9BACT